MSKVLRISPPESAPERGGDDHLVVTLRISELKSIVRSEVEAALEAREPSVPRVAYTLKEAAQMLSVPPTWLAARARAGEVPCVRLGHYMTFTEKDLKEFADKRRLTRSDS